MKAITVIFNGRKPWTSVRNRWESMAASELENADGRIIYDQRYPNFVIIVADYVFTMNNMEAWFIELPTIDYLQYSGELDNEDDGTVDLDDFGGGDDSNAPDDLDDLCLFYLIDDPDDLTDDELFDRAHLSDRTIQHESQLLVLRRNLSPVS